MPDPVTLMLAASVATAGGWAYWKLGRGRAPSAARAPEAGSVRALGDLLEELRRTSRSMTESLDRRASELKVLIAEADRRLEALRKAPPPAVPSPAATIPDVSGDVSPEMKAVFDRVYAQADGGRAVTDIARDTGLNKTAVTLILGLRAMHHPQSEDAAPGRPLSPR